MVHCDNRVLGAVLRGLAGVGVSGNMAYCDDWVFGAVLRGLAGVVLWGWGLVGHGTLR